MNATATAYDPMVLARARRLAADGTAKRLRQSARLSLSDVAERLDVSAPTVWRWEESICEPRREVGYRYGVLLAELNRLYNDENAAGRRRSRSRRAAGGAGRNVSKA
jgi:transcriptional regulator with XRE-family HTH domain